MATIESRTLTLTPQWLRKHYLPGARCSECKTKFKRKQPAAGIACLRNSAGGNSWYPLCGTCGTAYNTRGNAGIPNCVADAGVPILKRARVTQCAGRCKLAFTPDNPAVVIAATSAGDYLLCASCFNRWKAAKMADLTFKPLSALQPKKDTE